MLDSSKTDTQAHLTKGTMFHFASKLQGMIDYLILHTGGLRSLMSNYNLQ